MQNNISVYDYNNDGKKDIIYSDGFNKQIHFIGNSSPLNTDNLESKNIHFEVYPNPVQYELNITSLVNDKEVVCNIINSSGKL